MPYISGGNITSSRPSNLGSLKDLFWGVLNFFYLFFTSLVMPNSNSRVTSHGQSAPRNPGRRGMGGFGGRGQSGPAPPPMGGG